MRKRSVAVLAGLLVAGVAGCSSSGSSSSAAASAAAPSTPDVCASADRLRTSLEGLGDVQVRDGTADLEQSWSTVQDDWAQFEEDARAQHADRVDEVKTAADAVGEALSAAQDDPSVATLTGAGAAVSAFVSQAGALLDEVGSTC